MPFPKQIQLDHATLTLIEDASPISGLNQKKFYKDEKGALFMAKVEKERGFDIFNGLLFRSLSIPAELKKKSEQADFLKTNGVDEKKQEKLQKHIDELRDEATAMAVIAPHIAMKIFPFLCVPENHLCRLDDGTPVILSKFIPGFTEFLKKSKLIKEKKPTTPMIWKKLPKRAELELTEEQAQILGQIYYVALLMGHWDIINNIDLTNSGTATINGKLMPCIVDWGNCPQGFGGVSQASTSFQNPEFKRLKLQADNHPVTGFTGCVPFDGIVYPKLPRQVVPDLFDLTAKDKLSKAMLAGFKRAHQETSVYFSEETVNDAINETLKSLPAKSFRSRLNQEFYGKSEHQPGILGEILAARLRSLDGIIQEMDQGRMMDEIANAQFNKIEQSQEIEPIVKSRSHL